MEYIAICSQSRSSLYLSHIHYSTVKVLFYSFLSYQSPGSGMTLQKGARALLKGSAGQLDDNQA